MINKELLKISLFLWGILLLLQGFYLFNSFDPGLATSQTGQIDIQFGFDIRNVFASNISNTYATINWKTSVDANNTINFGTNLNLTSFVIENGSIYHNITLTGLNPGTTYYYNITAYAGNLNTTEGPFNFTTLPALDDTPPVFQFFIPSLVNGSEYIPTEYNFSINFTDDDQVDSVVVEYNDTVFNTNLTNGLWFFVYDNFTAGLYDFNITATDRSGNKANVTILYEILKNDDSNLAVFNQTQNISSISIFQDTIYNFSTSINNTDNNYTLSIISNGNEILNLGSFIGLVNLSLNGSNTNSSNIIGNLINLNLDIGNYNLLINSPEDDNYLSDTLLLPITIVNASGNTVMFKNVQSPYEYAVGLVNISVSFGGANAVTNVTLSNSNFTYNAGLIQNNTLLAVGTYNFNLTINNTVGKITIVGLSIEVQDTIKPLIENITIVQNNSFYDFNEEYLLFDASDLAGINNSIITIASSNYDVEFANISIFNLYNQTYYANLSVLGAGTYVFVIKSTDNHGNIQTKNGSFTIAKNDQYELDFELNDINATSFSFVEDANVKIEAISTFNKSFDIYLVNTATNASSIIAINVTNYINTSFLIASPGTYELRLISESNNNFVAKSLNITLTITAAAVAETPSTGGGGGGGGGGGSGGVFVPTTPGEDGSADICITAWDCDSWSSCTLSQNGGSQSRTCELRVDCGEDNEPLTQRSCQVIEPRDPKVFDKNVCREAYDCDAWSACSNNRQVRTCTAVSACTTSNFKPKESRSCDASPEVLIGFSGEYDARVVDYGNVPGSSFKSAEILDGDIILVKYQGRTYQIDVYDARTSAITGRFKNTGKDITLKEGKSYYYDLDGDGSFDAIFTLIDSGAATLYVHGSEGNVQIQSPAELDVTKKAKKWLFWFIMILVCLIFLVVYYFPRDYIPEYVRGTKKMIKR